jgi:RNA polymerase sigma-70 factor (ECF subfamily)
MAERISDAELKTIYRETITSLYAFASRRCGGRRELAEDVVQEAWLRAVRTWGRTGVPNVPLAWLTTVARNLILNSQRRREGVPLDEVSAAEVLAAVDDNTLGDSGVIAALVSDALLRIPQAEARLLESFHYDRFKMSELAEAYGVSERAIEGRLRRARDRLRKELETTLKAERGIA